VPGRSRSTRLPVSSAATSCVHSPAGKCSSSSSGPLCGGAKRSSEGVKVGDQHVVGLQRLEAAGLEATPVIGLEEHRRRGVADQAVADRGLALELGCAARRAARLRPVGRVGLRDGGGVQRADERDSVDPLDGRERRGDALVLVQQQRGVEPGERERPKNRELAPRVREPRRHDRAAGSGRSRRGAGAAPP